METREQTQQTPAELRAAARAAKKAALEAAKQQRSMLMSEAADALASHRAGVKGAKLTPALSLAAQAAALTAKGARAQDLLREAEVATTGYLVDLPDDESYSKQQRKGRLWTRQDGEFLRRHEDLTEGSFATGRSGRPRDTWHGYTLLIAETRKEQRLAVYAATKAQTAGDAASDALRATWAGIVEQADAIERAELGMQE